MNEKLRKIMSEACRDMGLTSKALEELCEMGSQGLTEESTDEDVKQKADSLIPFAKMMQGEITRKMSKKTPPTPPVKEPTPPEPPKGGDSEIAKYIAEQLAPFKAQLDKLQGENEALKAEKAKGERTALIVQTAKKLGIPDYLVKRYSIADDADIEKELNDFKQELVNASLLPKDSAQETSKKEEDMKADAKAWAESLPNA